MKRAITSLILNALLFVTTIDEIRHIRKLVKTTNSLKENQNEKVNV